MEIDENVERMDDILEEIDGVFESAAKEKIYSSEAKCT